MAKTIKSSSDESANCFNRLIEEKITEQMSARLSRRQFTKRVATGLAFGSVASHGLALAKLSAFDGNKVFPFSEIPHSFDDKLHVAEGFSANRLISWGDSFSDKKPMDVNNPSVETQNRNFGFNNDFIAYLPINGSSNHGVLCVNHEYAAPHMMFSGYSSKSEGWKKATANELSIMKKSVGLSVIEVKKISGDWQIVRDSQLNRRIDLDTPMQLRGPAAGHKRLQSKESLDGIDTFGTMGNCAGGKTPWQTILTAEENFDRYFSSDTVNPQEKANYSSYETVSKSDATFAKIDGRFDSENNPLGFNHFGWMVEVDPFKPATKPKKLTALGRFQHEGASIHAKTGQPIVVYMGDDGKHECLYKFVSKANYQGVKDTTLLDEGTLYVAQFVNKMTLKWIPLVAGQHGLTPANGFNTQADVLIETRRAAKIVGGTPMDRPEDVEVNPKTGRVYAMLTNNKKRVAVNHANPRLNNRFGHILEMIPPNGDHTAVRFDWNILIMAGNPKARHGATYHPSTNESGWFANPDNVAFDHKGGMWVATDGCEDFGFCDGLWQVETEGRYRGLARHFLSCPKGAELCGPEFTPDGNTLFVSIQHPGDSDGCSRSKPSSRWPHFDKDLPPLPSVVAITKSYNL